MTHSKIALGLWPIAGITTLGVTPNDAGQTIQTAIDSGVTTFDTAFSYGYEGESDRLLGQYIRDERKRFCVIGKVGQRWTADHKRVIDATPTTLIQDAEASLHRIGIDSFDLLMLHSPDPNVPIEKSATTIRRLQERGLCHRIGVCNVNISQLQAFRDEVGCDAIQCPLNLLQRAPLHDLVPLCANSGIEVYVYWTLMKGLLAGKISRDHDFAKGDSRPNYTIFQGAARQRAHQVLDGMADIANKQNLTIAQLSIGWAVSQPGVTAALVGAHRPEQIRETAMSQPLEPSILQHIDALVSSSRLESD